MKKYFPFAISACLLIAAGFGFSSCKEDEPPAKPKLSFAQTTMTVDETDGVVEVQLNLDKPYGKDLNIEYTLGGTASDQDAVGTANADYEVSGDHGVVAIKSGSTSGVIELEIYDDALFEEDETIEISILDVNTSDIEVTADDEVEITITSDDGQVTASFATTAVTVNEAHGAEQGFLKIKVQLDKPAPADMTLQYTIDHEIETAALDSSFASANNIPRMYYDYYINGKSGELLIKKDSTFANIEIGIFSDFVFEDDETIKMTLTPGAGAQVGTNNTTTITVQQQNGKVILLMWHNRNYTDVDMDLFLWVGPDTTQTENLLALSTNDAPTPELEFVFVPSVVESGAFGLSHNYYSGSADPMEFEVHFADYTDGVVEDSVDRDVFVATYTAANINPWFDNKENPLVVQTFMIVDGVVSHISKIKVPTSGSRTKSSPMINGLRRKRGASLPHLNF